MMSAHDDGQLAAEEEPAAAAAAGHGSRGVEEATAEGCLLFWFSDKKRWFVPPSDVETQARCDAMRDAAGP